MSDLPSPPAPTSVPAAPSAPGVAVPARPATPSPAGGATTPAAAAAPRTPASRLPATPVAGPAGVRPSYPPRTPAPVSAPAAAPAPAPTAAGPWPAFFRDWPQEIPHRGVLITQLNEAIAFKGFMLRDEFVLLERLSPDSLGARFVVTPYGEIALVKITDPLKQPAFEAAGFRGALSM